MNAFSFIRKTHNIGARAFRARMESILREPRGHYRVHVHNTPAVAVIPDDEYLRMLEVLQEIEDMGLSEQVMGRLRRENRRKFPWFFSPEWQAKEREVDRHLRAGRVKRSKSLEVLSSELDR